MKTGIAIHCHHNILIEHCYDYDERVNAIITTKPNNEVDTRLRLFKLLQPEAIDDIPAEMKKAAADLKKVDDDRKKPYAEWDKADKKKFHDKWCGCKEWNGEEIIF